MTAKKQRALSLEEFGSAIGLSAVDREVVRQKNRVIDTLKTDRLRLKLSQAMLAKRIGTKQPAIARMEAGHVGDISFDFLVRVALVLGVGLDLGAAKRAA